MPIGRLIFILQTQSLIIINFHLLHQSHINTAMISAKYHCLLLNTIYSLLFTYYDRGHLVKHAYLKKIRFDALDVTTLLVYKFLYRMIYLMVTMRYIKLLTAYNIL